MTETERSLKDGQTVLFEAEDEDQAGDFFIQVTTPLPSRLVVVTHKIYAVYSSDCGFNFVEIARQASAQFGDAFYEYFSDESDFSFWRDGQVLLHPHGPVGRGGRKQISATQKQVFVDSQQAYGDGFWEHLRDFIKRPNWTDSGYIISNT